MSRSCEQLSHTSEKTDSYLVIVKNTSEHVCFAFSLLYDLFSATIFCHNVLEFSLHDNFVKCMLSLNFPSNFSTFMLCSLVFISFFEQTLNSVHGSELKMY